AGDDTQGRHLAEEVAPRERSDPLVEGPRARPKVDPDDRPPGGNGDRRQAVVLAAEVEDAVEFRSAAEPAGEVVGPAVVTAAKAGGFALLLAGHPGPSLTA